MTATILSLDTARAARCSQPGARRQVDPAASMFRPAPPVRAAEPPSEDPGVERAADVLREMEARPWIAPVVRVGRDLDRRTRVHVAVGGVSVGLDAADARLVARGLRDAPGEPGAHGIATILELAADQAEAANAVLDVLPARGRALPAGWWVVGALAVAALILAVAVVRSGG